MNDKKSRCIDAGTENCPCYLALTDDCLTCSRLQGKDCQQCNWQGVCIYNEFIQGNKTVNNPRKDFEADVLEVKSYDEDLLVMVIRVDRGFALKCNRPGIYVFIGNPELSAYHKTPISILKSDVTKGEIHLAVKIHSAKTKALLGLEKVTIRGPYKTGLIGDLTPVKRALVLSKGIGIAPGIHYTDCQVVGCIVDFMIDLEKINQSLLDSYLEGEWFEKRIEKIEYISFAGEHAFEKVKEKIIAGSYDSVLILASDYFVETLSEMIGTISPNINIIHSNNANMCCGEGVCGACTCVDKDGNVVKRCKCRYGV